VSLSRPSHCSCSTNSHERMTSEKISPPLDVLFLLSHFFRLLLLHSRFSPFISSRIVLLFPFFPLSSRSSSFASPLFTAAHPLPFFFVTPLFLLLLLLLLLFLFFSLLFLFVSLSSEEEDFTELFLSLLQVGKQLFHREPL
jgi:hypothetical protein